MVFDSGTARNRVRVPWDGRCRSKMPREYPEYPIVGVGAVVLVDDKVLLVKRAFPPSKGKWSIPGGVPKPGEPLVDAVLRELYEETNIKGRVIGLIDVEEYIERDVEGRVRYHYVLLDFLIEPLGEIKPRASTDALDARFWMISEALKLDLSISTRKLLSKIEQYKGNPPILPI